MPVSPACYPAGFPTSLDRRKPLAAAGYTLANIVKPLLAVTHSWKQVFWIRFADRAAKGFRAAPRDALMADSVDPAHRGAGFGLRQAMDTAGAIVGPLSAILFLKLFAGKIRDVFWVAAIPGLVCILLAWFAVKEVRRTASASTPFPRPAERSSRFPRGKLLLILAAVAIFSLGNSSDLFLILRAQNLGMRAWTAPALGLLFNVVYAALSWPVGKLSDRVPRRWLIVAGYLIYSAVYAGFALLRTPQLVWFLFAVYGTYYALTEGVMKAWIADLAPADSRASALQLSQIAFSILIGVGAASLISISLGEQKREKAEQVLGNGFFLMLLVSVTIAGHRDRFPRPAPAPLRRQRCGTPLCPRFHADSPCRHAVRHREPGRQRFHPQ